MPLRKEFTDEGGAVWVIIGDRSGWSKSDYRRVYLDDCGRRFVKYRYTWKEVRALKCRVIAIMEDGEVRDA